MTSFFGGQRVLKEDEPILPETKHSFADALENGDPRPSKEFFLIRPAFTRRFYQNLTDGSGRERTA